MTDKVHPGRGAGTPAGTLRWPELVLGLLLLAVGGGVGALLLGTKGPLPEDRTSEPEVTTSAIPASPGTVAGGAAPAPAAKPAAVKETSRIPPAPPPPPVAKIPPPVLPEPVAPPPSPPNASAPTASAPSGNAARTPTAPAPAPVAAGAAGNEAKPPVTAAAPVTASPQPGGAIPTSEVRTPLRSDYRVTLGTFSSQAAVAGGTAAVRALGYTVYAIDLGDQFVAQVGPFADEDAGNRALTDIQRVYPRALLYRPRGQATPAAEEVPAEAQTAEAETAEPTAAEESAAPAPATQEENVAAAPETVTAPPEPATPAPPAGPVYLQVGAFNSSEGAQRFVEELRARGLSPSVNAPAEGKVTVLLGPFEGAALLATEGQLDAAGYDHFRLR